MHQPRRKSIRLPSGAYREGGTSWLISIATQDRQPIFGNPILAGLVAAIMEERADQMGIDLDLYVVMPDHAHLIINVKTGNVVDYVRDFKSRTTRVWWADGGAGSLWQRSFHDKGLRSASAYQDAVGYVLNNPVESGLVVDWHEYDLIGGRIVRES